MLNNLFVFLLILFPRLCFLLRRFASHIHMPMGRKAFVLCKTSRSRRVAGRRFSPERLACRGGSFLSRRGERSAIRRVIPGVPQSRISRVSSPPSARRIHGKQESSGHLLERPYRGAFAQRAYLHAPFVLAYRIKNPYDTHHRGKSAFWGVTFYPQKVTLFLTQKRVYEHALSDSYINHIPNLPVCTIADMYGIKRASQISEMMAIYRRLNDDFHSQSILPGTCPHKAKPRMSKRRAPRQDAFECDIEIKRDGGHTQKGHKRRCQREHKKRCAKAEGNTQ